MLTMYGTRRRNNRDVEADILKVAQARGAARKTHIVYGANLNFKIVKRYLASLLKRGLLRYDGSRYTPTEKAAEYLAAYEALSYL